MEIKGLNSIEEPLKKIVQGPDCAKFIASSRTIYLTGESAKKIKINVQHSLMFTHQKF